MNSKTGSRVTTDTGTQKLQGHVKAGSANKACSQILWMPKQCHGQGGHQPWLPGFHKQHFADVQEPWVHSGVGEPPSSQPG